MNENGQAQTAQPATPETVPGETVIALPPDTEPAAPPMEVISVDELLDRLTQGDEQTEVPAEGDEPGEALADIPVEPDPILMILEQVGGKLIDMIGNLDRIEEDLESMNKKLELIEMEVDVIEQAVNHPALTTSFAEYTVTEALLLLLLLSAFISACARMLRGGLSWLRS